MPRLRPAHAYAHALPFIHSLRAGALALALIVGLIAIVAAPVRAQLLLLPEDSAPSNYPVGALELQYAEPHPDQPSLGEMLPVRVELTRTPEGWVAPRPGADTKILSIGGPNSPVVELDASGLARVLRVLVSELHETGLYGVDVRPASEDIDLETERDLRPADRTRLGIVITLGRVSQVRTIAVGSRVKGDWKIDNDLHEAVREDSPLKPPGIGDEDTTDLLNRRSLEDYLYRLNRYPGRRVEAALSPGTEPGEAVLDYRVLEAKPWFVYAQTTNTGTKRTSPWQTRVGATHRQLTNRDDTLSVEYLNAGGNDVNGVRASYQAPFFGAKRPGWMKRRAGDPEWLEWLPREKIPWWGVDRLRWEVNFGWNKAESDRSSTFFDLSNDRVTSENFEYGGRFIYEAFQYRDFFVDVWSGVRLRQLDVVNRLRETVRGEVLYVIPAVGLHAERINQLSTLGMDVSIQGGITSANDGDRDTLGRQDSDGDYARLDFNLGYSAFLEPLLAPSKWRDPSTELSSTLAHELAFSFRGQYAFDYRLVPQASQSIGGLYSVRGFNQSFAVGDTVLIGSVEYRFHLPRALPVARQPLRIPLLGHFRAAPQQVYGRPDWDLTFRAFFDVGRTIRNDVPGSGGTVESAEVNQTLLSAGVGAELQIRSNIRARLDWATPLDSTNGADRARRRTKAGTSEVHLLFSILY